MKKTRLTAVMVCLIVLGLTLAPSACRLSSATPTSSPETESWQVGENLRYGPQAISGDNLVFHETIYGEGGVAEQYITLYNLRTRKKERLVPLSKDLFVDPPSIDRDRIVWASARKSDVDTARGLYAGNWDIFLFDLRNRIRDVILIQQVTGDAQAQVGARISGDTIVRLDSRNVPAGQTPQTFDIYSYDLRTNEERRVTSARTVDGYASPTIAVSGDFVVWTDVRHADPNVKNYPSNSPDYNNEIYLYDLKTSQEKRVTTNLSNDYYPAIDGSRIVWLRRSSLMEADVFLYDLNTGSETKISHSHYAAEGPGVSGDMVVWADARTSKGNTAGDVGMESENGAVVSGAAEIYSSDLKTDTEALLVPSTEHRSTGKVGANERSFVDREVWLRPVGLRELHGLREGNRHHTLSLRDEAEVTG